MIGANHKDYLGDGVYVEYDGYTVVLYTSNGVTNNSHIYLEPEVIEALNRYIANLKENITNDHE